MLLYVMFGIGRIVLHSMFHRFRFCLLKYGSWFIYMSLMTTEVWEIVG